MTIPGAARPDETEFVGRGVIDGLGSPRSVGEMLPALFQEDEFCQRLTAAFDEVLAPIISTLDCLDCYLDPYLAPEDFVDWLASWVGIDIDETWQLDRRRRLVDDAVALYRARGTAAGLAAHVGLYSGATPEIVESGGCGWSSTADTPLPGSADPHVTVVLRVADPASVKQSTVDRIVASSRPAHMPFRVEVLADDAPTPDPPASADASRADASEEGVVTDIGPVVLPGSESIELAPLGPESPEAVEIQPGPEQLPPEGQEPPA